MEPKKKRVLFKDEVEQNASSLVRPYSSTEEKKFGKIAKVKLFKDNHLSGKVKYEIHNLKSFDSESANQTYKATLTKDIKSGTGATNMGIAKERSTANKLNASVFNLPLKTQSEQENARMLSRQIASWKVARNLNLRVLSREEYAKNTDGSILGVSAMLPSTAQSMSSLLREHYEIMQAANLDTTHQEKYLGNVIFSGEIQKQLSDLQLIDALVGQTDRHAGNIYIDLQNQKVYGIDNDQSFETRPMEFNGFNSIASFFISTKKNPDSKNQVQKLVYNEASGFEFKQNQIDKHTANKVLSLTEDDLRKILIDKIGEKNNEHLSDQEIEMAQKRLRAIKVQIHNLKAKDKLVDTWGNNTYHDSLTTYGKVVQVYENIELAESTNLKNYNTKFQNYVAREVNTTVHNKTQDGYDAVLSNDGKTIIKRIMSPEMKKDFGAFIEQPWAPSNKVIGFKDRRGRIKRR